MNKELEQIKNGTNLRQTLIGLRSAIREEEQKKTLAYTLAGDFSVFTELLSHEDPKVRKNAALILGEMECDELTDVLWEAYVKEQTLFVRADYLKAMYRCDCSAYVERMKEMLDRLMKSEVLPEEEKHIRQECAVLNNILLRYERPKKHKFIGYDRMLEMILMTNRNHRDVTREQLGDIPVKYLAGGMRFHTDRLKDVLVIRTYSELLFPLSGCGLLSGSPERMAGQMMAAGLLSFLQELHEGKPPFYFRLEVKSMMQTVQKVDLVKKLSAALERCSERRLVNAISGYEIEIRLVANKEGRFVPLLKLFTVPDWRFAYRRQSLPTSIAPVNAALIMQLAKEHLRNGAQVLDPFCGVGTLLIERSRFGKTGSMYGLDILEEAIQKARENTQAAKLAVNYINRDYFDFTHEYLFDEIVTNLPVTGKTRDEVQLRELYDRFFEKSASMLKPGAIVVAYTAALPLLREAAKSYGDYTLLKEYIINDREGSGVEIFVYRKAGSTKKTEKNC